MASDHFGWSELYEEGEGYWERRGLERQASLKADAQRIQAHAAELRRQMWNKKLSIMLRELHAEGIEQVKELSYRKIIFLECWLNIGDETAQERIQSLQDAERLDRERRRGHAE